MYSRICYKEKNKPCYLPRLMYNTLYKWAKEMLKLNLVNCRNYGIDKVLITCDADNLASEKTILANHGVFEKEICVDGDRIKRYWISLNT